MSCMYVCIIYILFILGEYNLGVHLGLTDHIKHLQCRSTEEIWNLYRISFLPSIMHCVVKTLRGMIWTSADLAFSHAYHLCLTF